MSPDAPSPPCPGCGRLYAADAIFCPSCGRPRDGASRPSDTDRRLEAEWGKVRAALEDATRGTYEIRDSLGRGGMAAVYRGYDLSLRRDVALKVMSPALLLVPHAIDRFSQEARTMAAMKHPNIVGIHDVVDSPLHYLVMEYVEGLSLDRVLKTAGLLPVRIVQVILFHVAQALQHAHARGVVHRDIKPSNIMLDLDGNPMVMDFGIAKAIEGGTQSGATSGPIGTAEYMSPEQILVKPLTGASDQYSLGVVAYHLLAGQLPFSGTGTQVMMGHLQQTPGPLSKYRADCPAFVEKVVLRMMAKEPSQRFAGVVDAIKALGGHAKPEEGSLYDSLKALAAGGAADASLAPAVPSGTSPTIAPPRRRWTGIVGGAAAVGLVAAGFWASRRTPETVVPDPVATQTRPPAAEPVARDSVVVSVPVSVPVQVPGPPAPAPAPGPKAPDPIKVPPPGPPPPPPPPEPPAAEPVTRPDSGVRPAPDPAPAATDVIDRQNRALVDMIAAKNVAGLMGLYRAEAGTDPSWQDKMATLVREDLVSAGLASIKTELQADGATTALGVNVSYRDPVAGGKRSGVLSMVVRFSRIGDQWSIRSFSLTRKPPT